MKVYSSTALAALAAGAIVKRRMVLFSLAEPVGFWDGLAPYTPTGSNVDAGADGVTFNGGGSLIAISPSPVSASSRSPSITLQLRSVPNSDLTPDVLGEVMNYAWHKKTVSIYRAIFTTDRELIEVALAHRGKLDSLTFDLDPERGTAMLTGAVEANLIEWNRWGAHDRGHESQILTWAGDLGLKNIEKTSQIRKWGKAASRART